MTATAIAAPEAAFEALRDVGLSMVHRMGVKYSVDRNSPFTSTEDFEQEVWSRLWEWLGEPDHVEQAIGLLEDDIETKRFLNQFARARICDLIDVALAGPRDQRLTITASFALEGGDKRNDNGLHIRTTLLEHLAYLNGYTSPESSSRADAIDSIREAIGPDTDAKRIFNAILEQPRSLRENFCESRLRLCEGQATLTEAETPSRLSTLLLSTKEGYAIEDQEVTWDGPLPLRHKGTLETSQGEVKVSTPEPGIAVMRWTETSLTVRLDWHTNEGEFWREVIRPSPRVFDYKIMRDYLGISGIRIRKAWLRLQPILKAKLGVA